MIQLCRKNQEAKPLDVIENVRNEFKVKLTDKFEEEVISFLNTNGGNIYIGVNDKGDVIGINGNIDLLQRTIKDKIKDNIMPSTLGLYDVIVLEKDNKKYIKVIIARENGRPYYLKGMRMTPDSCFIRVGSSIQSMSNEMINNEFSKRTRNSLKNIVSPKQDLTFKEKPKEEIRDNSFLDTKGYLTLGDNGDNVSKIASFMRKTFPAYTSKKALGSYYGKYIKASITEFQKRTGLVADGNVGPITLAKLKEYGFEE